MDPVKKDEHGKKRKKNVEACPHIIIRQSRVFGVAYVNHRETKFAVQKQGPTCK